MAEELRLIVRIMGKDMNGEQPIFRALMSLKGLGHRMSLITAQVFEKQTGIPFNEKIGKIPEEKDKLLEEIILQPEKFGVPGWCLNRQKEFETGQDKHLVSASLDLGQRKDIERMRKIKCYKGVRHGFGLPVRGQRTRSNFRRKGAVVGVVKKDIKAKAAPARKGDEKKEKKK